MKTVVVKTSMKPAAMKKVMAVVSKEVGKKVSVNDKFAYKNFGYLELVFDDELQDHAPVFGKSKEAEALSNPNEESKNVFQRVMRSLARKKIWVTCQNVTIVTNAGMEEVKTVGSRYNGHDYVPSCKGCQTPCEFDNTQLDDKGRPVRVKEVDCEKKQIRYKDVYHANLSVDKADAYGFMRGKTHVKYTSKKWYTDGVPDEDGDLEFVSEHHGTSECYSNYKHHNREKFQLLFTQFDDSCLGQVPYERSVKETEDFTQSDDISTLTGKALEDALANEIKRPKNKQ